MVDHTTQVVANIIAEGAYGGGVAGAAYAETNFADNEGVPMQLPFGSLTMPMALKNKVPIKPIGKNMGATLWFDNGIITPPVTIAQYLQDDRWIDSLINGYTVAAVPVDGFSQAIHWENAANILEDVFGVMPTKWVLDLDRGENNETQPFPKQTTTLDFLNSEVSVVGFSVDVGFNTTQSMVNSNMAITLDKNGANAIDLLWKKCRVSIEMIRNKKGTIGDGGKLKYPYALDYKIGVDLTFFTFNAIVLEPARSAVAVLGDWDFEIDLGTLTKDVLTIDNLFATESNVAELPEFGLFEYTLKLEPGDTFVHSADLLLA